MTEALSETTVCETCAAITPKDRAEHHAQWHESALKEAAGRAIKKNEDDMRRANLMAGF